MLGLAAGAAIASLAVIGQTDAPRDFIAEIEPLFSLINCTQDQVSPEGIDAELYRAYCEQAAWTLDRHHRLFDEQGRAFFDGLLPPDLPKVIVHPFAASDLTSALDTFPGAEEIITISEEHGSDPRKIAALLSSKPLKLTLKSLIAAQNGALLWSDSKGVSTASTLALFLAALAAHGDRLVSLRFFRIDEEGELLYLTDDDLERMRGGSQAKIAQAFANTEMFFTTPEGATCVHRHIASSLADGELARSPALEKFLEKKGAIAAIVKSSSYRLWQPRFSKLRDYLLAHMVLMVSDSTGIPVERAKKAGFEVEGYGHFAHTIGEQSERYNRELRAVFGSAIRKPLPFRFGYLDADRHFHLVITRKASSPPEEGEPAKPRSAERVELEEEDFHGGKHWRLWTRHDAVHVFQPANYQPSSAGTVVFVHGYYVDADQAWTEFELGDQFSESGRNALFIAPEATIGDEEDVFWPDLGELVRTVAALTKAKTPEGPVVVIAHSGGFRTVLNWLGDWKVREIVLLDGAYGRLRDFKRWVEAGSNRRQLVLTSSSTAERAREFVEKFRGAAESPNVPEDAESFPPEAKAAPVIYIESQYEHTEMVKNKKVIPILLRLSPLPAG
jgi:hypothetical protein